MKTPHTRVLTLILCVLPACVAPAVEQQVSDGLPVAKTAAAPLGESLLYGRDGKPVLGSQRGAARIEDEPRRDIGESEGGRASLLELYTTAVAERNALAEEVANLKATLGQERRALEEGANERALLRGELTKLTRERDASMAEAQDLAARLTTAQIARLEAQKALLEMQIDARMREEAAASVQGSAKDKKRSTGEHK